MHGLQSFPNETNDLMKTARRRFIQSAAGCRSFRHNDLQAEKLEPQVVLRRPGF